jgi:predicted GH43/DUF377 family glycosyl hydrolase
MYLFVVLALVILLTPIAVVVSAPQAAWVKYAGNPVFRPADGNAWDNKNVLAAKVVFEGDVYRMWYTANGANDLRTAIGYATSSDGLTWTRQGSDPVLSYGAGWESHGVSAPSVLYDPVASQWKMWYAGRDYNGRYSIGYATSPDGITWSKYGNNPVLARSNSGQDDASIVSPHVLYRAGTYHMWYAGRGSNNQIFYATSSDGINWSKHPSNPVLRLGGDYTWDNGEIAAPSVIWTGARYEMWYQGYSRGTLQRYLGHATSTDGATWTKDVLNPVVGLEPNTWDSYSIYYPSVGVSRSGQAMLWYQGEAGTGSVKQLGVVLFDLNAQPTPLPTFPNEPPTPTPVPPTPTEGPTPTPTLTLTPIPVECDIIGKECVMLPAVSK